MNQEDVNSAIADLIEAWHHRPYDAFSCNWICLLRLANLLDPSSEHKRLVQLLQILPEESATHVLEDPSVEALIGIQPPLESIISSRHERLDEQKARRLIETTRAQKKRDPKAAIISLTEILKRIRNRREHGFKTPDGPRDEEILGNGAAILRTMVLIAAETLIQKCGENEGKEHQRTNS